MSSRQPPHRLVDVLKKNSPATLKRHAEQLAVLQTALPPHVLESRYQQNRYLISPKSLHLLVQPDALRRWGIFAIYKPAFCPMKRQDAHANYHRVSVESFLAAALHSREVLPVVRETMDPRKMRVRVLYSLSPESSGPVMVSLREDLGFVQSLKAFHFSYQLLVAGHLPTSEKPTPVDPSLLYPTAPADMLSSASTKVEVKRTGYYAHHPASLVEVQVQAPPLASPPSLHEVVRTSLKSFILGDRQALTTKNGAPLPQGFVLRGDCDFPRVFSHLRQVRCVTSIAESPQSSTVEPEPAAPSQDNSHANGFDPNVIDYQCINCLEPIFRTKQIFGLKGISLSIYDGSWSPMSELLP